MKKSSYGRKLFILLIISNILLLAVSVIYGNAVKEAFDGGEKVFECAVQKILPIYCPGCGGSRSLMFLLEFDIVNSFIYYPALPVSLLIIIYFDTVALVSALKNDPLILKKFKYGTLISVPVIIIINFILRNVILYVFKIDYIGDFT